MPAPSSIASNLRCTCLSSATLNAHSDLTGVFTAPPEFVVLAGRVEVGTIGTDLLTEQVEGPRILLLGGRSWKVTHVDWERRRCFVEPADGGGTAKGSGVPGGLSYGITRGMRSVLLGSRPAGVMFTGRAAKVLEQLTAAYADTVSSESLIVRMPDATVGRWWPWPGTAANRTLQASLASVIDPRQRIGEKSVRLIAGVSVQEFSDSLAAVEWQDPAVDPSALRGLRFSAALPTTLALKTVDARLGDAPHAGQVSVQKLSLIRTAE